MKNKSKPDLEVLVRSRASTEFIQCCFELTNFVSAETKHDTIYIYNSNQ